MSCNVIENLVAADSDCGGRLFPVCGYFLCAVDVAHCALQNEEVNVLRERRHEAPGAVWSGCTLRDEPGGILLALFPGDLHSLIKTNKDGILHADKHMAPGRVESFDPDGRPSLAADYCVSRGAHKSRCINSRSAEERGSGPRGQNQAL